MTSRTTIASLAWCVVLVACGGGGGGGGAVDARPGTADAASSDSARSDAPVTTSAPVHTLFINTDGVTLMPGNDDATTNQSGLASHATTLAPWMMNDAARATKIGGMLTEVQTILAPYDITVVGTRPSTGDYDMFVITDSDATGLGFSAGQGGIATVRCGAFARAIAVQFAPPYASEPEAQRLHTFGAYAIATFGVYSGIPQSNVYGDCMCYTGQQCGQINAACQIGGAGTAVFAGGCNSPATMDEKARFLAAFGAHP
jgi:hypothetical protein